MPSMDQGKAGQMTVGGCAWGAVLAVTVTACALPGPTTGSVLRGAVTLGGGRQVQATSTEIGTAATVSLIDPATSRTIATTLTQPNRTYTLSIPGFKPQEKTYILEAVKGLHSNLAGHDAARLRTLVRWSGTGWQALTTGDASLDDATTALAAIVGLRSFYAAVNPDLLMDRLTLTNPDPFDEAATGVSQAEFDTVRGLVGQSLADDRDALEALLYDGSRYWLKSLTSPAASPFISHLSPTSVSAGSQLTIDGGNFRAALGENAVTLNGVSVTVLAGEARSLLVRLPGDAESGLLQVSNPEGVATLSLLVTPAVAGGVLPATSAVLVPNAPGTEIPGSVFGR